VLESSVLCNRAGCSSEKIRVSNHSITSSRIFAGVADWSPTTTPSNLSLRLHRNPANSCRLRGKPLVRC
jgi:hypothetical protein